MTRHDGRWEGRGSEWNGMGRGRKFESVVEIEKVLRHKRKGRGSLLFPRGSTTTVQPRYSIATMADSDIALPKALTDFVFDLYDSITLSQLPEEQAKLYSQDFQELSSKYAPWPLPQAIASECNGDPLFLAIYRELTQRQFHQKQNRRTSLRDRIEGWQVYKDLFDEILESDGNFYLIPEWVFEIMHEFIYEFQGFCQARSAVHTAASKYSLLQEDGNIADTANNNHQKNIIENYKMLQANMDAWDTKAIFQYLHRLGRLGVTDKPVYAYLSIFAAVSRSRLECLLGDYTACLEALTPLTQDHVTIPKDGMTISQVLQDVFGARLSVAYHAGVAFLLLRRYKDAVRTLGEIGSYMERGFKTGLMRRMPNADQHGKMYERILSLLAILQSICPTPGLLEETLVRALRERFGSRVDSATNLEEYFLCPKFISTDPKKGVYRHQVSLFLREMEKHGSQRSLRSYLKLYTSVEVAKLAKFHDCGDVNEFLPQLLSFKSRMNQVERGVTFVDGDRKMALDIHFYLDLNMVHVDEAEKQRHFENFFLQRIAECADLYAEAAAVETAV